MIEKKSKNSIQWLGGGPGCNTREVTERLLSLKEEILQQDANEIQLDKQLTWARQSMVNIIDDPTNQKFSYTCHQNMCQKWVNGEDKQTIIIKAPIGTTMSVETVSNVDLMEEVYMEDDGIILDKALNNGVREDSSDHVIRLTPTTPSFETTRIKARIRTMRSNRRCNNIHIKSNNGPANVFLLNRCSEAVPDESGHPSFKRAKLDRIQKLIEEQRVEQENMVKIEEEGEAMEQSICEETRVPSSEFVITSAEYEEAKPDIEELERSLQRDTEEQQSSGGPKRKVGPRKVRDAVSLLPSRHLSPRRAAQHHLFVPTIRSKVDQQTSQDSVLSPRGSRRKGSEASITAPSTEEMVDQQSSPPPPIEGTLSNVVVKEEIFDENSSSEIIEKNAKETPNSSPNKKKGKNKNKKSGGDAAEKSQVRLGAE